MAQLLAQHPFTAQQLFQRLHEAGYAGGYTPLTDYVRQVRPASGPAFLTLQFAPGQCAQVDWVSAGWLRVGATRRRLPFFVMVLCYSRRLYVEFTLRVAAGCEGPKAPRPRRERPQSISARHILVPFATGI